MSKKNKIIISLSGGLGNQMFQYSAYLWLKQKGLNVYLDKHYYTIQKSFTHNKYKLDYFENINDIDFADIKDVKKMIDFSSCYTIREIKKTNLNKILKFKIFIKKLLKNIVKIINLNSKSSNIFNASNIFYLEMQNYNFNCLLELDQKSNMYIWGLFAHYKHLNDIKDILLNRFLFKKTLPQKIIDILTNIKNCNSVAVHVRRGDYAGDPIRDVCSMSYYRNAIQYISSKYNDLIFFIFSNDIDYIKTNFFFLNNYEIIENTTLDIPDYYDLFIMTQVKHLIISNSTFAWWGAWLNQSPEKTVIVPELYHKNNSFVSKDKLYPPEWIKLAIN